MATLAELARTHTDLDAEAVVHVQRLVSGWNMLADLCFADLLLFARTTDAEPTFVVLGQMRPTTSQTLHRDDLVGRLVTHVDRPLVERAWRLREIVEGEVVVNDHNERARVQCIPVRRHGNVLGVMTREAAIAVGRRPGELERTYVSVFDRFARMIVRGEYPFDTDDLDTEESPRVGDGVLVLDGSGRVEYASPNAVNALHRMGIHSNIEGARFDEVGIEETAVSRAFFAAAPVTEEVERRPDVIVLMRAIPLLQKGEVAGGVVLLRDVTDIRRRDRLLLSKDATIREVHHRVKNNLQTISSLLRLQARRLDRGEARVALEEAERRIRSIALVHEILSRDAGEQVAFNDIVRHLVRMAEDAVVGLDERVDFVVEGDAGELPAEVATPLAIVISELLQNAAEHAFTEKPVRPRVEMRMGNDSEKLTVDVEDNGAGWPPDFSIETTKSLGLSIVRDLVRSQLSGTIDTDGAPSGGAAVRLHIPLQRDRS